MSVARKQSRLDGFEKQLKEKGITFRGAAESLGCDASHLFRVVRGQRVSRSLVKRLEALLLSADKKSTVKK